MGVADLDDGFEELAKEFDKLEERESRILENEDRINLIYRAGNGDYKNLRISKQSVDILEEYIGLANSYSEVFELLEDEGQNEEPKENFDDLNIRNGQFVVYDRDNHEAWIQGSNSVKVTE